MTNPAGACLAGIGTRDVRFNGESFANWRFINRFINAGPVTSRWLGALQLCCLGDRLQQLVADIRRHNLSSLLDHRDQAVEPLGERLQAQAR